MEKLYTRDQLEKKLKLINNINRKDLEKKIKEFNLSKSKKEVNYV